MHLMASRIQDLIHILLGPRGEWPCAFAHCRSEIGRLGPFHLAVLEGGLFCGKVTPMSKDLHADTSNEQDREQRE